jgi:hypothetical protein
MINNRMNGSSVGLFEEKIKNDECLEIVFVCETIVEYFSKFICKLKSNISTKKNVVPFQYV